MLLTIADELIQQALQSGPSSGRLYGRIVDGDVAQARALHPPGGAIGRWARMEQASETAGPSLSEDGELLLLITLDGEARAYLRSAGAVLDVQVMRVRLQADYGLRFSGLFESSALSDARVTVIGLGSGGALLTEQLVRCGVGSLTLVDCDRLETQNISRHICGLDDIGRYKTLAVADLLRSISPAVAVRTIEADILAQADMLTSAIDGADLVVVATDREGPKLAANRVCWTRGIPAVYGAAYNRAFGGDVFLAIPPDGACYACLHDQVADLFADSPLPTDDFTPGYADPRRMADLLAEPGLPVDIGMIALITARAALQVLLRGRTILAELPTNWVMFGNRAEWAFTRPLESIFVDIPRRLDCPVCHYSGFVQSQLGGQIDEIEAQARRILDSLEE
jgi:molybdopterin/thiamine biosynthesis adenylyltransferase